VKIVIIVFVGCETVILWVITDVSDKTYIRCVFYMV